MLSATEYPGRLPDFVVILLEILRADLSWVFCFIKLVEK